MASLEEVVSDNFATNNENASPPKRSKKDDIRARLKEWQAERGRAVSNLPWQRPPVRKGLAPKKDAPSDETKPPARKPFSLRQDTSSVSAKVDCKWSASSNFSKQSTTKAKQIGSASARGSQESLHSVGNSTEPNFLKANVSQRAQSTIEELEKLPKGFNVAQWRAARRAHYAERVREQETKRRQTLAAAQHNKVPPLSIAPEVRRQTMAVSKRNAATNAPSVAIVKPLMRNNATSRAPVVTKPIAKGTKTSAILNNEKPDVKRKNVNIVKPPTAVPSLSKARFASITSKINTRQAPKSNTDTPKPSKAVALAVKNQSNVAPKLKRLAPKSPTSKVGYYCLKTNRPSAKKPTPKKGVVKGKGDRRKSAFKTVLHSRPPRRSTILRAAPLAKPANVRNATAQQPASKKVGTVPGKKTKTTVNIRQSKASNRISLTALHRKGGQDLVKAKERLVREVKARISETKPEEAKKLIQKDVTIMSIKKARSVSFYVPVSEEHRPCTPDESERRDRLETWLQSKGKTVGSFRHCRCFSEQAIPDLPRSVRRRPPTPGVSKLASLNDSSVVQQTPDVDRRLTIDLTTLPAPLNWDESPELKLSRSNISSPPEKDETKDLAEGASPEAVLSELHSTLSELADSLHEGKPFFEISEKLDELCETSPQVQKIAKYWLCRAEVAKQAGNDSEVMRLLQLAFDHGAEPLSELQAACDAIQGQTSTIKRKTPRRRHENLGGICESSMIKFKVSTPAARKSLCGNIVPITPVRRSVRLKSKAEAYHLAVPTDCVDCIEQLPSEIRKSIVYKPNEALSSWDITVEYVKNVVDKFDS